MLADTIDLSLIVLPNGLVLFESSFIARAQNIGIIVALYYFGRIELSWFWDFMGFEGRFMGSLGF